MRIPGGGVFFLPKALSLQIFCFPLAFQTKCLHISDKTAASGSPALSRYTWDMWPFCISSWKFMISSRTLLNFFWTVVGFLKFLIFFVKIVLTFQTKRPLPLGHLPAWDKYTFGLSPGFTTFHFLWNLNLYQAIWSPVSFAGGASTGGYIFAKIYFCRIRILSILFIIHKASSLLQ